MMCLNNDTCGLFEHLLCSYPYQVVLNCHDFMTVTGPEWSVSALIVQHPGFIRYRC